MKAQGRFKCRVCGQPTSPREGRCTNGRCRSCHERHCTPGGSTGPGHGLGSVKERPRPTIEERAVQAMLRTWNAIGADLEAAGGEGPIDDETLRDVIPDCNWLEDFGGDDEAVAWFRSLGRAEQRIVLRQAFKN